MKIKSGKKMFSGKRKDIIYYCIMMAWPVLQFVIFYIGVNFNSFVMSFQKISYIDISKVNHGVGGETTFTWTLENYFGEYGAFAWIFGGKIRDGVLFRDLIGISLRSFLITICTSVPLGLLFSYYIFKKLPGWSAFRAILFLPSILSAVVMAAIYRFFVSEGLNQIIADVFLGGDTSTLTNLFDPAGKTRYGTIMAFNIWIGFGTSVIMYANKMSGISQEIFESAHLDGATGIKEFIHIVFPLVYSTLSVFLITMVAGICSNQINLYAMFGGTFTGADAKPLGYYLYTEVKNSFRGGGGLPQLPYYSALGIALTLIAVPFTLIVKWALEKFGPSED